MDMPSDSDGRRPALQPDDRITSLVQWALERVAIVTAVVLGMEALRALL